MKRIIQSKIFLIVMCGIIFGSIGVYAASYLASDIKYIPTNANWNVENVNEALDNLYDKSLNEQSYETLSLSWVGNGSISSTIDLSTKLKNYKNVKAVYFNNIPVGVAKIQVSAGYGVPNTNAVYDSSTGILTLYASVNSASTGHFIYYNGHTYSGEFVFLY